MVSGKKRNQLRQAGPSWAGGTRASGTSLDGRGGSTEPTDPPQPTGLSLQKAVNAIVLFSVHNADYDTLAAAHHVRLKRAEWETGKAEHA